MQIARMTTKGQVTIPKTVRERLQAKQGDLLVFEFTEGGDLKVRSLSQKPLSALFGALPATRPYPGKAAVRDEVGKKLAARSR